jgi:hypothetical protein
MTLLLGMSKPEGIYLCADYRVINSVTGQVLDDAATKCLTIHYPPFPGGTKALLAFTGIAVLPDGTPTMTWIRETLRGEAEYPDQSLTHLRFRLNRDYARLRQPLIINILALHENRRFFGGISNLWLNTARNSLKVIPEFLYEMREIEASFFFANGGAAAKAMADEKLAKLRSLLDTVPRAVLDHMRLMAIINRRVAARESSVSSFCKVSFINGDERFSPTSHAFTERGETVPFEMPFILGGLDLTEMTKQFANRFEILRQGGEPPPGPDAEEINRQTRRRP